MMQTAKTFLTTFVVLVVVYVGAIVLVWKAFDSQRDTKAGAQPHSFDTAPLSPFAHESLPTPDDNEDSDMVLPPLGDLSYETESASDRSASLPSSRSRSVSFADKLDAAMSRPLPQRHRAPPRPSMDITQQIAIDDADDHQQLSPPTTRKMKRSRRNARPQQEEWLQPADLGNAHMDEVIRDMNSKSGIARTTAPETKVVYPNEDATYGAEPTTHEPGTNSILLSPEQRIMMAHRASLG